MLTGLYPNNAYRLISKQCLQAYIQTMLTGLCPNNAYRLISKFSKGEVLDVQYYAVTDYN